jgi:hypothetical protein
MKIGDKLVKVDETIHVNSYDNGYMVEVSGEDKKGDKWTTVKIICTNMEQVYQTLRDWAELPKND